MITRCPSCQSDRRRRLFDKNGCRIHACRACGTWFVADPPPVEDLHEIYRERYFAEKLAQHDFDKTEAVAWRAAVANARRRMPMLRRYAPRARRLLDVGCGTGAFLSVARHEYDCRGLDVSAEAVAVVKQRLGIEAHAGDLESHDLPDGAFDAVTMFDVIEHVPDPAGTLAGARRLLAPRGIVLLTTGDTDSIVCRLTGPRWHLMTPPEHLTFFSRAGIVRMLARCDLNVEHVSHQPVRANVGYMADKLAHVAKPSLGWLPRVVSLFGLARRDIDVNLLDVLTLVARRV